MTFSVKVSSLLTLRADRIKKQVRFAAAVAINDVAKQVQVAERKLLASTFERPRPFTVNSVGLGPPAKPDRLVRKVFIKDKTAAYLDPYEFGGLHYLPERPELGRVVIVPVHAKIDAYGQMTKKYVTELLQNAAKGSGKNVFIGQVGRVLGIWQRIPPPRKPKQRGFRLIDLPEPAQSQQQRLILLAEIVPNQTVPKHLGFAEQGLDLVEYLWPSAMEKALTRALLSAR